MDVDEFLKKPLNAYISLNGPSVRPTWFLWEDGAFWISSGPWAKWWQTLDEDPKVALVVDDFDVATGRVEKVTAKGKGEVHEIDVERAKRLYSRYVGEDESRWDPMFHEVIHGEGAVLIRIEPEWMKGMDLSYERR
ncbi:hypothetical protein BBK82_11045 [Lentzea guizhouensis]|uniref:Pyridoxamine 5'-phosphate oxidase N-terminal domain-containing protein n=1 Tax=Lentzea guizhouensis TaxID=1586287 RepID=A0A1B2HFQ2_9PSEU|nr:pyridoxamine 5'-phosphate oxidase family protein [Lentzea guizhouensis]ANZ36521.1 hypothetical protein BBK82_11045 [Lentzea guizhouensis]